MADAGDVLAPGTRLDELEIERVAGHRGGFGVTYLVRDLGLEVWRAVKEYLPRDWATRRRDGTVAPRTSDDAEDYRWGLERFLDEARILARFRHPHIVHVHRVFEARGTAYMVMEYVEGRTLTEEVKAEGPLSEARVREVLLALTEGLSAVHVAGLLHRDIKPENVMVRPDGTPVLIDFGSARQAMGRHSRSVTAVLTPGYAPIEQYSARGDQGPWTDIYALGALAYWALSGETPEEVTERVPEDRLPSVSQTGASAGLAAAVDAALAVDKRDRPQSLRAWRELLERPAPPPSGPSPGPRASGRRSSVAGASSRRGSWQVRVAAAVPWWLAAVAAVWLTTLMLSRNAGGPARESTEVAEAPAQVRAVERPIERERPRPRPAVRAPGRLDTAQEDPEVAQPSPAETGESSLGLDRAARRRIQEGLAALGFDPGEPDGLFGARTRSALRRWQSRAGRPVTGYLDALGAETLRAAGERASRAVEVEAQRLAALRGSADAPRPTVAAPRVGLRDGAVFRACPSCPEMVVIPAGEFLMGSPPGQGTERTKPQRRVRVERFALGRYEVTRAQYAAFAAATEHDGNGCFAGVFDYAGDRRSNQASWRSPGYPQTDDHPAVCVSWDDARAYVRWLSRETGVSYRLPSEAEWEYAARAGTTTSRYWGDRRSGQCVNANGADTALRQRFEVFTWALSCNDGQVFTAPVGTFTANAFGLFDVLGNVRESVEDCRHESYRGAPSDGSAWTSAGDCGFRGSRGGSWRDFYLDLTSYYRTSPGRRVRNDDAGFRVARTLD